MSEKTNKEDTIEETLIDTVNEAEETIDVGYTPFDEPVKKRDYTAPNIDASQLEDELEEPTFSAPDFTDFEDAEIEEEEETKKEPQKPFNPDLNELGNKEKEMGADMLAEMVIDGYARLKTGLGGLAKISEDKLNDEIAEGSIDGNLRLAVDNQGNTASIQEFVQEFNESTKDAFSTSDDFKQNLKQPLVRIFKRRGVGITDEQQVAYIVATDLATSGISVVQLRKTSNSILTNLREQTILMKKNAVTPPQTEKPKEEEKAPFKEPEEIVSEQPLMEMEIPDEEPQGFKHDAPDQKGMPEFGDPSILKQIDKIANQDPKPKPKRKYTRKKKTTKK